MIGLLRRFVFLALTAGLAASLSLVGGVGLEAVSGDLRLLVPLLIAVPSLNNMAGDYAAIIAAHMGDTTETVDSLRAVRKAIWRVVGINGSLVVILSFATALWRDFNFNWFFLAKFLVFVVGSILIVTELLFVANIVLKRILKHRRLAADDLLIPVTTALADVVMLSLVALAVVTIF